MNMEASENRPRPNHRMEEPTSNAEQVGPQAGDDQRTEEQKELDQRMADDLDRELALIALEDTVTEHKQAASQIACFLIPAVEASAGLSDDDKVNMMSVAQEILELLMKDEPTAEGLEKAAKLSKTLGDGLKTKGASSLGSEVEGMSRQIEAAAKAKGQAEEKETGLHKDLLSRHVGPSEVPKATSTAPSATRCAACGVVPAPLRCTRCKVRHESCQGQLNLHAKTGVTCMSGSHHRGSHLHERVTR